METQNQSSKQELRIALKGSTAATKEVDWVHTPSDISVVYFFFDDLHTYLNISVPSCRDRDTPMLPYGPIILLHHIQVFPGGPASRFPRACNVLFRALLLKLPLV